jgi:hypothetical protein
MRGQILGGDLGAEIANRAVDDKDAASLAAERLAVDEAAMDKRQRLMRDRAGRRDFQGAASRKDHLSCRIFLAPIPHAGRRRFT